MGGHGSPAVASNMPVKEDSDAESLTSNTRNTIRKSTRGSVLNHTGDTALAPEQARAVQATWSAFCAAVSSPEAAAAAFHDTLLKRLPALQQAFQSPRAVHVMRLASAIDHLVALLEEPGKLPALVHRFGYSHLNVDITEPQVTIFTQAFIDTIESKLGDKFTTDAYIGWEDLLTFTCDAIVQAKLTAPDHLKVLVESWGEANSQKASLTPHNTGNLDAEEKGAESPSKTPRMMGGKVPSNFPEMFQFNAAVMGFGNRAWMRVVLESFPDLVSNSSKPSRMLEECDVLVIRISKRANAAVSLGEFRACMLASLRSLLPKEWSSSYEVAWNWLWDIVKVLLQEHLGRVTNFGSALRRFLSGQDEDTKCEMWEDSYARFFAAAPASQELFKQSDSRLQFIAEQVNIKALSLLEDPWAMMDELSALGLRHVGYGVPLELLSPFITARIDALAAVCDDKVAVEGYTWSLGLIARVMTRAIGEGSTIVMKAVNANSARSLRKAIACAPRGQRTQWLLKVEVGTQSISPLQWAMESGCFEAAEAIFQDLLTIRADRNRYYYGVDDLFERHPDIVQQLCANASQLLNTFLSGLVWRSSSPKDGMRRVNYYVKHFVVDLSGSFPKNLQWLVDSGDPKIMAHPVVVLVSDLIWNGLICRQFVVSKVWFVLSLVTFMLCQAILPKRGFSEVLFVRVLVLVGRCLNYFVTMVCLGVSHAKQCVLDYRSGLTIVVFRCIRVPQYLQDPHDAGKVCFTVLLFLMLLHEPFFWCLGEEEADWPTENCDASDGIRFTYSVCCFFAMALHWLLLMDLAVFSTGLSIFLLVIRQVLSEIGRFIFALVFLLLTFGSALSVLQHDYYEMRDIPSAAVALFAITLRLFEDDYRDLQFEPALLAGVFLFVTASVIILMNLLVAQLNCSYVYIYQDMVGFARMNRVRVIVEMLEACPPAKFQRFVAGLKLSEPLEFNEGDVGLPGAIQVLEPASLNPVVTDSIFRFGGSASEDMRWPEEKASPDGTELDKFDRLERLVHKTLRHIARSRSQPCTSTDVVGESNDSEE